MLCGVFGLPPPAAVIASLHGSANYEELQHRWVHFPAVLPADEQLEQKLQQCKRGVTTPRLMHLPHQFQVCYKLLTDKCIPETGTDTQPTQYELPLLHAA